MALIDDAITSVKGVGSATAKKLEKLGIYTVRDMLTYYPFRTEDRSQIKKISETVEGETACIKAAVFSDMSIRRIRKNFTVYSLTLRDDSGFINAVWYNNKYVTNAFKRMKTYSFYGQIKSGYGKREIVNPVYEAGDKNMATGRIVPVYNLTSGLSLKAIQNVAQKCIDETADSMSETLPEYIRDKYELCEIKYAVRNIHFPKTSDDYNTARKRLVFEEFLLLNMGMRLLAGRRNKMSGCAYSSFHLDAFFSGLPYEFTNAQKRVVGEITRDLARSVPMNRLVQGDVGSGKTAVAAAALYLTAENGHQGAMMAPTELLASQHYDSMKKMLPDIPICLLTGATKAKERREIIERLKNGEIKLAIGTHALFSEDVEFSDLTLVVTDEQHRFGVRQRAALAEKSTISPHILVMTATPIPRTLALILYSDLDVSEIDELPPGRQRVDTFAVGEDMRRRIYSFIEKTVLSGNQVYIVCPMVEENDTMELKSVVEFTERLRADVFPDIAIGLIHGKMKASEKDGIMAEFVSGATKILVSTTVIEVGVDVPNATLMVIENAERFGLSQLHQLRGRVGRGTDKSYCVLFSDSESKETRERLNIMCATNDGFEIAKKDLELRGPGEIFGTRQHGLPEMKLGDLANDSELLRQASAAADSVLRSDTNLTEEKNKCLKEAIEKMFTGRCAEGMFN